jgi:hypothetical protein
MKRLSIVIAVVGVIVSLTFSGTAQGPTPVASVWLQSSSPGASQAGNLNISGTGLFGGQLALGTTTPARKLHVADSSPFSARIESSNVGTLGIELRNGASNSIWEYGVTGTNGAYGIAAGSYYLYHSGLSNPAIFVTPIADIGMPGRLALGTFPFFEGKLISHAFDGAEVAGHFHQAATGDAVTSVVAVTDGADGSVGVYGRANTGGFVNYGVKGHSVSATGYGIYSDGRSGAAGTKEFRIDHPADPKNKYLIHYSAEGPEPLLIYAGTARLDRNGEVWVELPDYFESITREPRIQLTPAGASMPGLYAPEAVQGNRFLIAGGKPSGKVYWEVKAIRNDLWVRTYGAPVEVEKTGPEKGEYQVPKLYGGQERPAISKLFR